MLRSLSRAAAASRLAKAAAPAGSRGFAKKKTQNPKKEASADGGKASSSGSGSGSEIPRIPVLEYRSEDPETRQARRDKFKAELAVLREAELERMAEDRDVVASNAQAIEDSLKFENRGKELELRDRPYYDAEDDPSPISPDDLELTDDIVDKVAEDALKYPEKFLSARLQTRDGRGNIIGENPNLQPELLELLRAEMLKDRDDIEQEAKFFFGDTDDLPEIPQDMRDKYHLDLYDNIKDLMRKEKFTPFSNDAFHESHEARLAAIASKKKRKGDGRGDTQYDTDDETPIIKKLPRNQRDITHKQNKPFWESFTEDHEMDERLGYDRSSATQDNLDKFSEKPQYDEFDEFRIKYGMDVYDHQDTNPFAPVTAAPDSSSGNDSEDLDDEDFLPVHVRADMFRLSGPTQEVLWKLHDKDPKRFTYERLAKLFELTPIKVQDVVELKQHEKEMIEKGEETTNLEWWFVQDMSQYSLESNEDTYLQIPYAQYMHQDYPDLDEKADHLNIDEIDIERFKQYDKERKEAIKQAKMKPEEVLKFAAAQVPDKPIAKPKRKRMRHNIVFTDLSGKKNDMFRVYVREKGGDLRNGSVPERDRAVKIERPRRDQFEGLI